MKGKKTEIVAGKAKSKKGRRTAVAEEKAKSKKGRKTAVAEEKAKSNKGRKTAVAEEKAKPAKRRKTQVIEVNSSSETDHEEEDHGGDNKAKNHSNGNHSTTTKTNVDRRSISQGKASEECLESFSMPRVRRLMKTQADLRTNRDSLFLISSATAMFLQQLVQDAQEEDSQPRKKYSLTYKKLSSVVSKQKRYEFISDFVPERLKAKDALSQRTALKDEMR
ncbi:hypothetical protein H6P81_018381 [Aristolochia fimbriata]|uniref:Transcription factor CBF/NF-Y/archaeal histone domain-containing protein n=1 Tax=Aristolochia fimbriata TaxID=158543 RepID=A0AAV7E539_ARIFI|nr:hypothetical protein H6P81_018381 [Aristolochia fimbriata]